jgi:hypothetical protein
LLCDGANQQGPPLDVPVTMEFILQQSFFVDEIYGYKGKKFYDIYALLFSNDCRFGYGI